MLIAAAMLALGFFAIAAITQTRGLRLGGTIVVPVLAFYTLKNFVALPVFLISFVLAYAALWAAKEYTLVFGRDELVVAIVAGSILPLGLLFLGEFLGIAVVSNLRAALFLGSILPGLAAYNVQQLKPGYRRQDTLWAVGLYLGLLVGGALLVDPRLASTVGSLTPPVLYAETADIAVLRGAVVPYDLRPIVLTRPVAVGILVVGFLMSEWGRDRFGVRSGVVTMGLLAVYATASTWLVVLFLLEFLLCVFVLGVVHYLTALYGRVLIGIGASVGAVAVVPFAFVLPIARGLSAVFVAVLAGTAAYNSHVTAPHDRRLRVPLALLIFAPLFVLTRLIGRPYETGLLAGVETLPWVLLLGVLVVVGSYLLLRRFSIEQPSDEAVLSASVLSGGEG